MKLLELFAEDLYSYESLYLPLKNYAKGTTLIMGLNLDMDSENGVGKSTLFKLIFLAIYGKDLKGVAYEKIVRVGSSGGSLVALSFEDSGSIFRIARWKNYKKPKSSILLSDGRIPSGSGVEFSIDGIALKTEGSSEVAEAAIAAKIGLNSKVFLNSIYTQQNKKDIFLEIPDSEKKDLLSKIFDLDFYDKALKSVNTDIAALERSIDHLKTKQDFLIKNRVNEEVNQKNLSSELEKELARRANRTLDLKKLKTTTEMELIKLKEFIELTPKSNIIELEASLAKHKLELIPLKEGQDVELSLTKLIAEQENVLVQLKEHFKRISTEIDDFNSKNSTLSEQIAILRSSAGQDFQKDLELLTSKVKDQELKIKALTLSLQKEAQVVQKKTSAEVNLKDLEKKSIDLSKDIEELLHNQECGTCHRPFKEGENALLESLIHDNQKKLQVINQNITDLQLSLSILTKELEQIELDKKDKTSAEANFTQTSKEYNELKLIQQQELAKTQQITLLQKQLDDLINKNTLNQEALIKIKKKEIDAQEYLRKMQPLLEEAKATKEKFVEKSELINKLSIELETFKNRNQTIDHQLKVIDDKESSLFLLNNELNDLNTDEIPLRHLLEKSQIQLTSISSELLSIDANLKTALDQMKYLNFWQTGFSKTGIRSFILDEIINLLNFKTKEYLDILSDRILNLIFQSEHRSKSGTVSNKISTLMYVNGEERVFELNSGGEAQRLNLAVDLALSDIAESRIGTHFNVKFLDEPFNGIGSSGQLKALALFNKLSEHRNGFFIISHDKTMQSFGDHKIYLIKENKITRVVDEATFLAAGDKV